MAFVNISLLLGGLMVAVPVILHLIMRRQPRQLQFPALRFLQQRETTNSRNLQLRHWLLLALRCLAIAFLAAALARPSIASNQQASWLMISLVAALLVLVVVSLLFAWRTRQGRLPVAILGSVALLLVMVLVVTGIKMLDQDEPLLIGDREAPVAAALVVDAAPRMTYRHRNQTRLEVAQEIASWLIHQLPGDSEVAVIDSHQRQHVFAIDFAAAEKTVQQIRTSSMPRPLSETILDALALVEQSEHERKELYVFTDLSQQAWDVRSPQLKSRLAETQAVVHVIDVGVEEVQNTALGELQLDQQALTKNSNFQLTTEVLQTGMDAQHTVEVMLEEYDPTRPVLQDGKILLPKENPRGRTVCNLKAGESKRIDFELSGLPLGVHQGRIRLLADDGLRLDNERFFTIAVHDAWPVLVVAPENVAAHLMTEAVAPYQFRQTNQAKFHCEVVRQSDFNLRDLGKYAAVCLLDPKPLTAEQWQRLAGFVNAGGGLGVFLGNHANPVDSFQEAPVRQLLGGKIVRQWRSPGDLFLSPVDAGHRLLQDFRDLGSSVPWSQFPVFRHWMMKPVDPETRVVMNYGNSKLPALVTSGYGQGRVVTLTTPITERLQSPGRESWNELSAAADPWPYFLLINRTLLYLVNRGDERLNYQAGETAQLTHDPVTDPDRYQLFIPQEDPLERNAQDGRIVVRDTEHVGAYRLKGNRGGPVLRGFAVNYGVEQSNLQRLESGALDQLLGVDRYQLARNREEIKFGIRNRRVGQEFYPFLVLMLVLVLALEHTLANRFYEKDSSAVEVVVSPEAGPVSEVQA
ncbi:MAG: hypothetical protein GY917_06255 [Planctomycetaceae bacterium]|nr:hypothetical protein [Planctomycetaceae bacterium]